MKLINKNKKAYFDYEILEDYEAGIMLEGAEVKSLRQGNVNMKGTFLKFYNSELFLLNMHIGTYKPAGKEQHDPTRNRKLLLSRKELTKLETKGDMAGNTLIPLEIYEKGSLIKVKIALARGKKKYEKKNIIKDRQIKREINRKLKNY